MHSASEWFSFGLIRLIRSFTINIMLCFIFSFTVPSKKRMLTGSKNWHGWKSSAKWNDFTKSIVHKARRIPITAWRSPGALKWQMVTVQSNSCKIYANYPCNRLFFFLLDQLLSYLLNLSKSILGYGLVPPFHYVLLCIFY